MNKKTKQTLCLIFIICCTTLFGQKLKEKNPHEVSSEIVDVIVYPKWAYVTRLAAVSLRTGITKYSFKNLPSWIDEDSLRVKFESSIECTIIGTSIKAIDPAQSAEKKVKEASKKVTELRDKIEDLKSELSVLGKEEKYLVDLSVWKLQKIPHESAVREVKTQELRKVKTFIIQELLDNVSKRNILKRKIRDLKPELQEKTKELNNLKNRMRLKKKEIVVEIRSKKDGKAKLFVSYLISGASWYPTYDARTDGVKEKVLFSCKAVVQQTTGENWNEATFTLSTIQPYILREKPVLSPMYIDKSSSSFAQKRISTTRRKRLEKIESEQNTFFYGQKENKSSLQGLLSNIQQAEQIIREVEGRGATVELKIDGRYSVATDGKPVKLTVGEAELKSRPIYTAVPSVSRSTYITTDIQNAASFTLLPGAIKIYIDGNFIGKSKIGFIAEGEEFELYLGFEERIKVTRELDFKMSSSSSTGKKKRLKIAYSIVVKNYLNTAASIEIHDQVPVSQNKAVKIKLLSHEPTAITNNKGIIVWSVKINPGKEQRINYVYQVEYPSSIYLQNIVQLERLMKTKRNK